MEICNRCIIPSSFPQVTFENGVCTFCRNHDKSTRITSAPLGSRELLKLLRSRSSPKYDCVVALSGGKASCDILDVRNATSYRLKLLREHLELSSFTGKFYACFNCENNLRTSVISEAVDREIPFILWGSTTYEDPFTLFLNLTSKSFREARRSNKVVISDILLKLFVEPLFQSLKSGSRLLFYYHHLLSRYYMIRDNFAMNTLEGWRNLSPYLNVSFDEKGPEVIYFFDYIQYDAPQMIATLQQELEWAAPVNKETRFDCKLGCFGNYQHLQNTGISKDGFTLSVLVRHGLMRREDALRKEENIRTGLAEECDRVRQEILSKC